MRRVRFKYVIYLPYNLRGYAGYWAYIIDIYTYILETYLIYNK